LDILFCGYVKDQAFSRNIDSADDLCAWISNAVASMTSQMLENMWNEIEYHLKIVWVTDGTHTGMH
jgi:hypothetical protein